MVELGSERQALQTAGETDFLQTPVEGFAKGQRFQAPWPFQIFQALVEQTPKGQALQISRQAGSLHVLVEVVAKD